MPNREAYNLQEMLSWRRPHESVTDCEFVALYLDSVPGMLHDEYGNRMISVGDNPTVAYMSHTDTVHRGEGRQQVHVGTDGLLRGDGNDCLGADDTTGVWLMLEMIRHDCPGLYIFHRGEEHGCLGSSWIVKHTPDLVDNIHAAISFDRRGYDSAVTFQSGVRTASTEWAKDLGDLIGLGHEPDDGGSYTDSLSYAHLIPECTNLSVGYHGAHTTREKQDYPWALALLKAMLEAAEFIPTIEIRRDPDSHESLDWAYSGSAYGYSRDDEDDPDAGKYGDALYSMYMAVTDNPGLAAQFLLDAGFQSADLED